MSSGCQKNIQYKKEGGVHKKEGPVQGSVQGRTRRTRLPVQGSVQGSLYKREPCTYKDFFIYHNPITSVTTTTTTTIWDQAVTDYSFHYDENFRLGQRKVQNFEVCNSPNRWYHENRDEFSCRMVVMRVRGLVYLAVSRPLLFFILFPARLRPNLSRRPVSIY